MSAVAGDAFEALGDPNRRTILALLGGGGRSVGELAESLPISRPAVSRHLRLLKEARLVVEEGLEYGPAKRRALRDLGLPARSALPHNDEIEAEVREYIRLYCADTQPKELHALRLLALEWMGRMAAFRPHVGGAVWHGTATRLSDIYIQLFCDDPKSAEIALIDHNVDYEPRTVTGFNGESVEALSLSSVSRELGEAIGIHLLVYDHDDLRGALRADARGRTPRGDLAAVRRLLQDLPET